MGKESSPTGQVVFLRHTKEHYAPAAQALRERVLARVLPGTGWRVTVVDNALPGDFHGRTPEGWALLGGDNSLKEFSGWEKALAVLDAGQSWQPAIPVLLVNDTFHRNYDTGYLDNLPHEPVADWLAEGSLVGHVDLYPREIELFGLPMRHWIRTSFVLATWGTLSRLLPFAPPGDLAALFGPGADSFFAPGGPLGERYKQYLAAFLLGSESEYACRWHTSVDLGDEGLAFLRVKAMTILCEHWLAARARHLGIALRDVSGRLAERERCIGRMAGAAECGCPEPRPNGARA
ncbi:hypothetical protein dsx2_1139 [Desulfovibrio sp. X2]|uniref:hypothetical protein n=1 Tax=Desulfovibrio sp. X2 TaxID=941449 RepID=UPI000358B532|nr:hypothetical protein [Desulfovibrio sp. X2]EPR37196.1 hypothetical protein dsx2_1139 [Desulfovibrio sp. X2]